MPNPAPKVLEEVGGLWVSCLRELGYPSPGRMHDNLNFHVNLHFLTVALELPCHYYRLLTVLYSQRQLRGWRGSLYGRPACSADTGLREEEAVRTSSLPAPRNALCPRCLFTVVFHWCHALTTPSSAYWAESCLQPELLLDRTRDGPTAAVTAVFQRAACN